MDDPDEALPGNGLLLFFCVDNFDNALKRARAFVSRFEEQSHVNPSTQTREFSLRDPDRYYVTIGAIPLSQESHYATLRPDKRLQPAKVRGRIDKSPDKP
ncbi:MAG TPA: hypothetical protein VFQ83_10770 [Candidatus Udaeobacter sp.]|jgi:hypothetical protein|nr:hypothetical protein [Candidatus Udaeobacter sp.]